jgi:hypothetical protein
VALRVSVPPTFIVVDVLFSVTPVTGWVTVTIQVAVCPPSAVLTVIVALPGATAVTTPLFTVAMPEGLIDHVTFLLRASEGATVGVRVPVEPPTLRARVVLSSVTPVAGTFTVTVQVAVAGWPSALNPTVVTVMIAVPPASAVTSPVVEFTIATVGVAEDHVTVLFVASDGATVAIRVSVPPLFRGSAVLFSVTPVTGTVTVTLQIASKLPSLVLTVIVALPPPTAVTRPLEFTVATPAALDDHVTVLVVALAGASVAVRVSVPPLFRAIVFVFSVTPVTRTGFTVTVQVAVCPPSAVLTVMVAVPTPTELTRPLFTVATPGALVDHVTFLFVALAGAIVGVRVSVTPLPSRVSVGLSSVTPVTGIFTVTVQLEVLLLSAALVAVMIAVPPFTAITSPLLLTVATSLLLDDHVTCLFRALLGATVAVRVNVAPLPDRLSVVLFSVTPLTGTSFHFAYTVMLDVIDASKSNNVVNAAVVYQLSKA